MARFGDWVFNTPLGAIALALMVSVVLWAFSFGLAWVLSLFGIV